MWELEISIMCIPQINCYIRQKLYYRQRKQHKVINTCCFRLQVEFYAEKVDILTCTWFLKICFCSGSQYVCLCVCVCVCVCVSLSVCECVCICMHGCICTSRCGLRKEACCRNHQLNKSKPALYSIRIVKTVVHK